MLKIYPYKSGSRSAKALSIALNGKVLKRNGSAYSPRPSDVLLNWGSTYLPPRLVNMPTINKAGNVELAVNKLNTYQLLEAKRLQTLNWTFAPEMAKDWIRQGSIVLGRKSAIGRGGLGIIIMRSIEDFESCMYYSHHERHKREYRIHIWKDEIVDITQKRLKNGFRGNPNAFLVRSHHNHFIFSRHNIEAPTQKTLDLAKAAKKALGLDFGAVDMFEKDNSNGKSIICEVNTAPGLEGQTLEKTANFIRENYLNLPPRDTI